MIWLAAFIAWVCLVALVALQPDHAITTEPDRPRGLWRLRLGSLRKMRDDPAFHVDQRPGVVKRQVRLELEPFRSVTC